MNIKIQKSRTIVVVIILVSIIFSGCSSNLSYQAAMEKNRRNISEISKLEDANFLTEAASYNLLEKQIAELGIERGYSSALVSHAREKAEEFRDMEREINKLARKKKIKVPGDLKSDHKIIYDRLTSSAKAEFDSEYIAAMEKVNDEHIELYREKSSEADDADVRSFAARNLGFLRRHADEIARVDDQLMHTHR
jgi:putative membrane protein